MKLKLVGRDSMNIAFAGFRHSHILGLYDYAVKSDKVNITGCFEEEIEKAKESVLKTRNIDFKYFSYEELLEDKNIEAVAIGDYYAKRGKMVIEALKKGKHVICDKPVCTDLSELETIEKLSRDKNLQVCCMLDLRYMPQVVKVKELIKSGYIGEICNVTFTGQHHLDYGNRPSWYFEEGKHGGTINDIAIHGVDLVRFITGKNLSKVNCAKVWNAFADKEPEFKDCGQFMAEMDDISVMADVSYAAPKCAGMPTYWDFYFWGKDGMINFKYNDKLIRIYKQNEEIIECDESCPTYLDDFISEINGVSTIMKTDDILNSQKQTLILQKFAERG